ncbi:hypothetical protein DPMN_066862 [Dreissena polymorpha]|uniref:Uncharacterized protein n=1 Tax=Dreissena polymorpha TaxID=45954 RepID=A0A9D3YY74_DREPO|nr:hypothetical protein DPMN_066862 [Dreissena polymorpha]
MGKMDLEKWNTILEQLNPVKSSGPDLLHPTVLKETKTAIVVPLSLIFKQSYLEGEVVDDLKNAHVKVFLKRAQEKMLLITVL